MCSEAKRLANQKNAQSSTGPKTDAGKARSRGNARKHGLAGAGVVELDDDRLRLRERVELWTGDLKPKNSVEAWLIERAAKASFRLDRCVEKEAVEIAYKRFDAVESWEESARESVIEIAENLPQAPAETVRLLQDATLGCDWLLTRWEELAESLAANKIWTGAELALALNLLGEAMTELGDASMPAAALLVNAFATRAERDPDEVDRFCGVSTNYLDPKARKTAIDESLPDCATAHAALSAIIATEVERLEALRELEFPMDKAALADAANLASFDRRKEASLMQRYETAHSLDLHRCLSKLAKMRQAEPADQTPAGVESQPVAAPTAAPASAPSEPIRNEPTTAGTNGQEKGSVNENGSMHRSNGQSGTAKNGSQKRSSRPMEVVEATASVSALV